MNRFITRIAPSPTGMMHLGTARTAYINYLAAKASQGKFILRIDDTDIIRNKKEYIDIILESLDWLGLIPDQVEYQSKRIKLYQSEADNIFNKGKAIQLDNGAIALLCPQDIPKSFNDSISGNIAITQTNIDQIDRKTILLRGKDEEHPERYRTPTYQFASTIDDYFLNVNWIIRGVDHITNTPKQIAIWSILNSLYGNYTCPKEYPKFTHLGLITVMDTETKKPKKLSKRDGAASLLWYKEQGYTAEAMLDWMLRLGWSLSIPRGSDIKEMNKLANGFISKDQAVEWFFEGKLKNSSCILDENKLKAIQRGLK